MNKPVDDTSAARHRAKMPYFGFRNPRKVENRFTATRRAGG